MKRRKAAKKVVERKAIMRKMKRVSESLYDAIFKINNNWLGFQVGIPRKVRKENMAINRNMERKVAIRSSRSGATKKEIDDRQRNEL